MQQFCLLSCGAWLLQQCCQYDFLGCSMHIGNRIKQAREQRGMSRSQLAALVGVTPNAITNYETGVSFPKAPVLCALFGALCVDANFLFQDYLPTEQKKGK